MAYGYDTVYDDPYRDDDDVDPTPPPATPAPQPTPPTGSGAQGGTGQPSGQYGPDETDPATGAIFNRYLGPSSGSGSSGSGSGGMNYSGPEFFWPKFSPPTFRYDAYRPPSLDDAKNEPGYQFARDEGQRALEHSAAGRGLTRTGGTLKDLLAWGNRFAEQNYSNVERRAADTYTRNYGVARDIFDRDYRGAYDAFQPEFRAAEHTFSDLYNRWRDVLNANTQIATAGAGL